MNPTECVKLENDKKFKKKYLQRIAWWKNFVIVPPSLILFLGLFGLLYLTKINLLFSIYSIPFIIIFLLATVWLKSVKKYLQNKIMEDENAFKVCFANLIDKDKKYSYFIFTNGQKSHNEHFIREVSKMMNLDCKSLDCKKKAYHIDINTITEETCYIIAYPTIDVRKANANWNDANILPLLYVNKSNTFIIK